MYPPPHILTCILLLIWNRKVETVFHCGYRSEEQAPNEEEDTCIWNHQVETLFHCEYRSEEQAVTPPQVNEEEDTCNTLLFLLILLLLPQPNSIGRGQQGS